MGDALGFPRRSRGVQHEQRVFAVHPLWRAVGTHLHRSGSRDVSCVVVVVVGGGGGGGGSSIGVVYGS